MRSLIIGSGGNKLGKRLVIGLLQRYVRGKNLEEDC